MSGDIYECDKCGGSISTSCDCAWGSDLLLCILNEEIKVLEEAVGFYADKENWVKSNMNIDFDLLNMIARIDVDETTGRGRYLNGKPTEEVFYGGCLGGKRARQALEKLKEIRKKK